MNTRSEQIIFGNAGNERRFDVKTVRRILGRAAASQYRLDSKRDSTFSLEELEEMAAEAGISRSVLYRALDERPNRLSSLWRWLPDSWSPLTQQLVFWTATASVLLALMLAFPVVANVLFWVAVIVLLMMALGVSPF